MDADRDPHANSADARHNRRVANAAHARAVAVARERGREAREAVDRLLLGENQPTTTTAPAAPATFAEAFGVEAPQPQQQVTGVAGRRGRPVQQGEKMQFWRPISGRPFQFIPNRNTNPLFPPLATPSVKINNFHAFKSLLTWGMHLCFGQKGKKLQFSRPFSGRPFQLFPNRQH